MRRVDRILEQLEHAAAALEAGAGDVALECLLEAWSVARLSSLAAAVNTLSARLEVTPLKVTGDAQQRYLQWSERASARRAADVGPLIAAFGFDEFERNRWLVFSGFPPDPRIHQLCAVGGKKHLDQRPLELSRATVRHFCFPSEHQPSLRKIEQELHPAVLALNRQIAGAALNPVGLEAPAAGGGDTIESMLAAIHQQPDDDGLRQIFADRLVEAGDPRGEFIALQFQEAAGTQSVEGARRERALLKKHQSTWLGPLGFHVVKKTATFKKGFLFSVVTTAARIVSAREAIPLPQWNTVREIRFGKVAYFGPSMRNVREARDVTEFGMKTLGGLKTLPPLVTLTLGPSKDLGPEPFHSMVQGDPSSWEWLDVVQRLSTLEELVIRLPTAASQPPAEDLVWAIAKRLPARVWRLAIKELLVPPRDFESLLDRAPAQLRTLELNTQAANRVDGKWVREN